jgi:hypothetical protein
MMKRRDFLKLGGAVGLLGMNAALIGKALTQNSGFTPSARDPVAHVINRLTFGVTPELYEYVHQIGTEAFIEEQLSPSSIDDALCDRLLELFPLINRRAGELAQEYRGEGGEVARDLLASTLVRAIYSKRQLYERMVQFWSDHFSVDIRKEAVMIFLKVDDDRDVIRAKTFGNFRDLLGADAHSPAMLFYLDNHESRYEHPNENYARELMELHTMGVNGGYTEDDVKEVARAFTGWSITGPRERGELGAFRFRRNFHDGDEKVVMGNTLAGGRWEEDGEDVLDILAAHPATARFIAHKLVRRFVSDYPPDSLVTAAAQTFTDTRGDTRAVLRTIFASEEFWNAPPKFKRPMEYTVNILRALAYPPESMGEIGRGVFEALEAMGHVPFTWHAPNGFPDVGAYWINNLLPRWNLAISAIQYGGEFRALGDLLERNGVTDLDGVIRFMGRYLWGRDLNETEFETVRDFGTSASSEWQEQALASTALLIAAPAFQFA